MEIFTFVCTGASLDRIMVMPITDDGQHDADDAELSSNKSTQIPHVTKMLKSFDSSTAQCFKKEDREHLLGVIEAAFGSLDAFNGVARQALKEGRRASRGKFLRTTFAIDSSRREELMGEASTERPPVGGTKERGEEGIGNVSGQEVKIVIQR